VRTDPFTQWLDASLEGTDQGSEPLIDALLATINYPTTETRLALRIHVGEMLQAAANRTLPQGGPLPRQILAEGANRRPRRMFRPDRVVTWKRRAGFGIGAVGEWALESDIERALRLLTVRTDVTARIMCCQHCYRFVRCRRGQSFCSPDCRERARPPRDREERAAYMRRYRQHPDVKRRE
jgi:hypothetical protein